MTAQSIEYPRLSPSEFDTLPLGNATSGRTRAALALVLLHGESAYRAAQIAGVHPTHLSRTLRALLARHNPQSNLE